MDRTRHPPHATPGVTCPAGLSCAAMIGIRREDKNRWERRVPLTPDHVNPERPWPNINALRDTCADAGFTLRERFGIYPEYVREDAGREGFVPARIREAIAHMADGDGLVSAEAEAWTL